MTQPSEPTEAHHDEVPPEVQDYLDVDQAQENAEFERLHQRNRKRILIPLGLLIALCIILSFSVTQSRRRCVKHPNQPVRRLRASVAR